MVKGRFGQSDCALDRLFFTPMIRVCHLRSKIPVRHYSATLQLRNILVEPQGLKSHAPSMFDDPIAESVFFCDDFG